MPANRAAPPPATMVPVEDKVRARTPRTAAMTSSTSVSKPSCSVTPVTIYRHIQSTPTRPPTDP